MTQHWLEKKSLTELKQIALEFELSQEKVAEYGDRRRRSTWIKALKAAQNAGKTTQEYRNLPVIKACDGSQPRYWNEYSEFVRQLEAMFYSKLAAGALIPESSLEWMSLENRRFNSWGQWIKPGGLLSTYGGKICQILMIDKLGTVYYIPIQQPKLYAASIESVRSFTYPVSPPGSPKLLAATEHIRLMHEVAQSFYMGVQELEDLAESTNADV